MFQSFALLSLANRPGQCRARPRRTRLSESEARRKTRRPSISSAWTASSRRIPASFRAGCANGSASRGRSSANRPYCLMDEPFSALDVLTAETLRTDFLDLWIEHKLPTKAVPTVTHNIEEAVFMCDRMIVLSSNPGHVAAEIPVSLPYPRNRLDAEFRDIVDELYSTLTARAIETIGAHQQVHGGLAQPLPPTSVNQISGLIQTLAAPPYDGRADLASVPARWFWTWTISSRLPRHCISWSLAN